MATLIAVPAWFLEMWIREVKKAAEHPLAKVEEKPTTVKNYECPDGYALAVPASWSGFVGSGINVWTTDGRSETRHGDV